jgi:serine/threonine protein kinase
MFHCLDKERVCKVFALNTDNLNLAIKSIRREGEIYNHFGDHSRVIKCLAKEDLFVDLEYALYRHIDSYLKSHYNTFNEYRIRFAQEVIKAIMFVHSKGIIYSDLAARQFLFNSTLYVNLSDFGFFSFSNGDVLGFENSSHHLSCDIDGNMLSTIQSDLFVLGLTLYKIITRKLLYKGESDNTIAWLYSNKSFSNVTGILCEHIISGC